MPGCCAACKCPYPWCAKPQCDCHEPGAERARRQEARRRAELAAWERAMKEESHA